VHSDCLHVCGLGGHGVLSVHVHFFLGACLLVSGQRLHTSCSVLFVSCFLCVRFFVVLGFLRFRCVCICEVLPVGSPLSVACVGASVPQRVVLCVDSFILVVCAFGWGYLWMPFAFALVLGVYVACC